MRMTDTLPLIRDIQFDAKPISTASLYANFAVCGKLLRPLGSQRMQCNQVPMLRCENTRVR